MKERNRRQSISLIGWRHKWDRGTNNIFFFIILLSYENAVCLGNMSLSLRDIFKQTIMREKHPSAKSRQEIATSKYTCILNISDQM